MVKAKVGLIPLFFQSSKLRTEIHGLVPPPRDYHFPRTLFQRRPQFLSPGNSVTKSSSGRTRPPNRHVFVGRLQSVAPPCLHFDKAAPPARVYGHEAGYPKPRNFAFLKGKILELGG